MTTAYVHHAECSLHDMGAHHPECPARLDAIHDHLLATGLLDYLIDVTAPLATREHLERVHDAQYLDAVAASAPQRGIVHLDPDTAMGPHSHRAALRAAGAVVKATDMVLSGEADNAFCSVRPPGHHAERARAMGFCFFNNVAVGAAHALETHGLERVAIVDFDVHHGNGTENIFRDEPRVLMVSTFQHPFYPYSGAEGGSERMVNIPLAAYSTGAQFRSAVQTHWAPAIRNFMPQMLFVSSGFDAHRDDDMASLGLVEDDYAWVTSWLLQQAGEFCSGRIVSTLEGGYELGALSRSVAAHLRVLSGLQTGN